ncbi:hypothetical protein GKZ90_0021170 [Flavobacterium sp. MC2016-06]|jgi:hypothetical protein|uniref:hypothetical protein n=1 Tax=Flavobacterium sp. MC2016-06 TaxID=2676308 RepID=UPI0012BAA9B0|nr:hypothetical protein [Flavobacterium sp. MC2016-06]MBU3861013.1 hypothetical protein [Flavobacterium sp. MC2016-06]
MKNELNQLEQYQQSKNGIISIKSYPILNKLSKLTYSDIRLIELILSYQFNDQVFQMKYTNVAELIGVEYQTVKTKVLNLKNLKILVTDTDKNPTMGARTKIKVDIDVLIAMLDNEPVVEPKKRKTTSKAAAAPESIPVVETITETIPEPSTPEIKPETKPKVKPAVKAVKITEDKKKEQMRVRFERKFKYSPKGRNVSPAEFHELTDDKLKAYQIINEVYGLMTDDFDGFWLKVQELKTKYIINNEKQKSMKQNENSTI